MQKAMADGASIVPVAAAKVDHLMILHPADHLVQSYPSPAPAFATPAVGVLLVWG